MNDRAVNVLEQYDMEVLRTWKGRGAILFETRQGIRILKEYFGPAEKLEQQNMLLCHIKDNSDRSVECLHLTKDGALYSQDQDQIKYIVKDYFTGKECNIRDISDCSRAISNLALLHKSMLDLEGGKEINAFSICREFDKRTKELKKIRKFIKQKGQKNSFEIFLMNHFDGFLEEAERVMEEAASQEEKEKNSACQSAAWCHGDYQHHNLLMTENSVAVINFEKFCYDSQMKDLYLFLRKLLEKNNWSVTMGNELLSLYHQGKMLQSHDLKQLYFRFSYPEKFWKIANFYFNSGKAWIPERNMEKLDKLLKQQEAKSEFIKSLQRE